MRPPRGSTCARSPPTSRRSARPGSIPPPCGASTPSRIIRNPPSSAGLQACPVRALGILSWRISRRIIRNALLRFNVSHADSVQSIAMQDLRYALRSLRKQPIFTLVAVLTLTLGIGANTAIFSLLYQVLLRPLPYGAADRLVFVWNGYPLMGLPQASVSIPDYLDRTTQVPAFEDATLFTRRAMNLTTNGQPEQLRALAVTPSFFTTIGRQPFIGRGFGVEDAKPGADKFAVLTYAVWTTHFGADRSILGRDIRINGEPYQVTGV